jgi:membrane protein
MYVAAALTLTSLLAVVPIMTVTLSVFASFPAFQKLGLQVEEFLFRNFVPTTGAAVQEYLVRFVDQASRIQLVGIIFFLATAVLLIAAIDKALNEIWQVKLNRPFMRTFLLYWAVLTLGPIMLGVSIGLTSYLVSFPTIFETVIDFGLQQLIYTITPLALAAVAFTFLYFTVPNRPVRVSHAVIGGGVAAILLEVAKRGFALYVTWVPTYRLVFGALAILPLFLIWLYLSWLVTILGAEIARALAVYRFHQRDHVVDKFNISYRVLQHFWQEHQDGNYVSTKGLLALEPILSEETIREVLGFLIEARFVGVLANGRYQLARDLRKVTLAELYRLSPWRLPTQYHAPDLQTGDINQGPAPIKESTGYSHALEKASQALDATLNISLETLYRERENAACTE